jgi:hypothetical protein
VKTFLFLPAILASLLFSCAPKTIEIPMTEAPPDRLVQALTDRARSFRTLRALADVTVARKDRRRSFDTVAVLVDGRERFKLEAFGPLGQSIASVLWAGGDVLVDMNGEQRVLPQRGAGLERVLGAEVEPAELCAILSGNIPDLPGPARPTLRCAANNICVLELRDGERAVKVYPAMGWEPGPSILPMFEVYQDTKLVYRVRYGEFRQTAGYDLPRQIVVETPAKQISLKVNYAEADVNMLLDPALFLIPGPGGGAR